MWYDIWNGTFLYPYFACTHSFEHEIIKADSSAVDVASHNWCVHGAQGARTASSFSFGVGTLQRCARCRKCNFVANTVHFVKIAYTRRHRRRRRQSASAIDNSHRIIHDVLCTKVPPAFCDIIFPRACYSFPFFLFRSPTLYFPHFCFHRHCWCRHNEGWLVNETQYMQQHKVSAPTSTKRMQSQSSWKSEIFHIYLQFFPGHINYMILHHYDLKDQMNSVKFATNSSPIPRPAGSRLPCSAYNLNGFRFSLVRIHNCSLYTYN